VNHAVTAQQTQDFVAVSSQTAETLGHYVSPAAVVGDSRDEVTEYIRTRNFTPNTMLAMRELVNGIGTEMSLYKDLKAVPQDKVRNFRNDMYVVSEGLRLMQKSGKPQFSTADAAVIKNYKSHIDNATKFIPSWVKVAVALALGMGTMIGWKRIVVTVGEKIGKDHLTYGQGAAAEITAMFTIGAADWFGMPVSTTHVLSSGVAGTMAANHTGLQWAPCEIWRWPGCLHFLHPSFCRPRCSGPSAAWAANCTEVLFYITRRGIRYLVQRRGTICCHQS